MHPGMAGETDTSEQAGEIKGGNEPSRETSSIVANPIVHRTDRSDAADGSKSGGAHSRNAALPSQSWQDGLNTSRESEPLMDRTQIISPAARDDQSAENGRYETGTASENSQPGACLQYSAIH